MSGDSGTSKGKKKDDAVAIDAAEPYVVTGAYLTCDFAEGANSPSGKSVGCSLMSSTGERIRSNQVDSLEYEAVPAAGAPIQPTATETSRWGAIWSSLSQLPKTRFKASVGIKGNNMEFSCSNVPCTSVTAFGLSGLNGIIEPRTSSGAFQSLNADDFCDARGKPISQEDFLDLCAIGKCGAGFQGLGNVVVEAGKNILDDLTGIFTQRSKKTAMRSNKTPDDRNFVAVGCIMKNSDQSPKMKKGNNCSVAAYKPKPNSNAEYFAVYPAIPSRSALADLNQVQSACN